MLSTWRKKFTAKEFTLTEDEPVTFVICQWQLKTGPSRWYLLYRWLIAIYFFTTWILSIIIVNKETDGYRVKWLIYLTNWGYTTCTFQAFLAALMLSSCVLACRIKTHSLKEKFLKAYKLYWVTHTIATVVACGITIIYWSLIYDEKKNNLDAMNFFLHAMNTVVMTLDFWLVSHPFRLAHCIYPVLFALTYAIFSLIYYLAGGTSREGTNYMYPILRWDMPFRTILVCFGVGFFFFLIHTFFYCMYWLKKRVYSKLGRTKSIELSTAISVTKNQDGYVNEAVIFGDQV